MRLRVLSKGRPLIAQSTDPDTVALKGQLTVAVMQAGMTILPLAMELLATKDGQQ